MTHTPDTSLKQLYEVLLGLQDPQSLDEHPWVTRAFVRQIVKTTKGMNVLSPGWQLSMALLQTFRKTMPTNPPRTGKRLDTRWGVFGLMAARYLYPFVQSQPAPENLPAAWGSIDTAILYFVSEKDVKKLSPKILESYHLLAGEKSPAPYSTLSDWHRKGLEILLDYIEHSEAAPQTIQTNTAQPKQLFRVPLTIIAVLIGLILFLAMAVGGYRCWSLYQQARTLQAQAIELQGFLKADLSLANVPEISSRVRDLRLGLDTFSSEVQPWLPLVGYLDWLPVYGGDVSQAGDVLKLGISLTAAGDEALQVASSLVQQNQAPNGNPPGLLDIIGGLDETTQPRLLAIQLALAEAVQARARIRVDLLSNGLQDLFKNRIDPLLETVQKDFPMEDAMVMARVAPRLLATGDNPARTYLVIIQNEDELRPTGGFLTAVGVIELKAGKIKSVKLESSELLDDLTKVFPVPPWAMAYYMNADVMNIGQANWFVDFPTTVKWVRYMYDYFRDVRVDGVIALDQRALVRVLEVVGPLEVADVTVPITSKNVLSYMRSAKERSPEGMSPRTWDRKQFLGKIALPLATKIMSSDSGQWSKLLPALRLALDERDILLQFDDPELAPLLARREWDGAVRVPVNSDFIMAVDSNFGFNKVDLVVKREMTYEIDLRDITHPASHLSLTHINQAVGEKPCLPGFNSMENIYDAYPIDECYWTYLRVYPLRQTLLTSATPHAIPAIQMARGEAVPARVDDLLGQSDEPIETHPFGTFIVVPQRQKVETSFYFELPAFILTKEPSSGAVFYSLKVQKQPGIGSLPFSLCVRIPLGAALQFSSIPLDNQANSCARIDLAQDLYFTLSFKP